MPAPTVSLRRLLSPLLAALTFLALFVGLFVSAFQSPAPHAVPLGVVGPPALALRLAARLPAGAFDVRAYASPAAARVALLQTDIQGAVLPGDHLWVAGASGGVATQAIETAFKAADPRLAVTDLRPLPASDSKGLTPVFTVFGCIVPSIVFAALLNVLAGAARPRARWTVLVAYALLAGLVAALLAVVVSGALAGAFWTVWAACSLVALAVAGIVHGLSRLFGLTAVPVCVVVFVVLGQCATGGALSPEFLPLFFRAAGHVLPNTAGLTTLRNGVYFAGHRTLPAILTLCGWLAAGIASELASGRRRRLAVAGA